MKSKLYPSLSKRVKRCLLTSLVVFPMMLCAQSRNIDAVNLEKVPPRIIRACCAFGYDLKLWGVPFVNIDQVIALDDLGEHHYMGNKSEGIGTIYSHKGGFIDIGHVRDQIDWTRFIYTFVLNNRGKGEVILPLRKEAGRKTLHLDIPAEFDKSDCILLAGKITYDLSLWHEISTWFGASTVPLIPEKFSSFTVEDVYSNLLGVHIGMKSLHSKRPFNDAATAIIASTLDSLEVVKTAKETYDAYDAVHNKWYTNEKRIPRKNVTLKRDLNVLRSSRPWIISDLTNDRKDPIVLDVPLQNTTGEFLTDFYQFTIDVNRKFPVDEIFPTNQSTLISQDDFGVLLNRISNDLQIIEQNSLAENK